MTSEIKQQHIEQINATREALVDKFKGEMSGLEDNVLLETALFISEDSVTDQIKNYLTNDGIGDMIKDKILGAALKKALAGNTDGESKGLELFTKLEKAREHLLQLDRKKAQKDFADELTKFRSEFDLQLNPTVESTPVDSSEENDEEVSSDIDIQSKEQILFSTIVSSPFERGKTSTLCSATAQKNAQKLFGLDIPSGNAVDAQNLDMHTATKDANGSTISSKMKDAYIDTIDGSDIFSYSPHNATVADVFVKSSSKYGHRCFAFKKFPQNEWYILDPYRKPDAKSDKPKKLSDYESKNTLVKVNFYETDKVVVDTIQSKQEVA